MKRAIATLAILLAPIAAYAGAALVTQTPTDTGISAANLSASPTVTINTQQKRPTNQLSLIFIVVKGTSTKLRLTIEASVDGASFGTKYGCTTAALSICSKKTYSFDAELVAGETEFLFDVPTNYPFTKITLDDPDNNSGTVSLWTVRGF